MNATFRRISCLLLCVALALTLTPPGSVLAYLVDPQTGVTYEGNGKTGGNVPLDADGYSAGAVVTVLGNSGGLVRTGFVFGGWLAGAGILQPGDKWLMGTSDVVLEAAWIPVYKITYERNAEPSMSSGTIPVDSALYPEAAVVTVKSDEGNLTSFSFGLKNWNTRPDGTGTVYTPGSTFEMGEDDVTLYAIYMDGPDMVTETFGILYDANGAGSGTVPGADTGAGVKTRSVSGNVGSLLNTGFRFDGWNTKVDGTGTSYQQGDEIFVDTLLTLYARWQPSFTLTYDLNEGFLLVGADNVDTFVAGSQVQLRDSMIALPFSFQPGSGVFVGWNTKADGTGTAYMPGDVIELASDWTLYPKWVDVTGLYGITYLGNGNDGGRVPPITHCFSGMTLIVPGQGTLERTGYRFVGWADGDEALYLTDATFEVPGHDLVLRAVWLPVCHVT